MNRKSADKKNNRKLTESQGEISNFYKIFLETEINTRKAASLTNNLKRGTVLRYIQELLGHKSPKTTEIYTHVSRSSISKINNPLDSISID